eukprot:m.115719 g.115719  ORF g.115719 m.115719 type:complete len:581 (+) comp22999_c0_seq2:358-2100(+)
MYVQPLCSPTRATIMTGRYASHTGIGPDVIVITDPYGLPAREKLLPEYLKQAGYATHAIGKWHLGACDERYEPTFRGFSSYMGYLQGAQDYYDHSSDFRNGSGANLLPKCLGPAVKNNYSTNLYAKEANRVVMAHNKSQPLFLYMAFQSVHNPYDVPPMDVNATFPNITNYDRRIYAGMVSELDKAVASLKQSFEAAGLWDDTLVIFSADNGGIGPGNNYPLRGQKVHDWEGGMRAVSFVRGTNSNLARVPANTTTFDLMHSTDWLPTLCHVAGCDALVANSSLPLDGYNQWPLLTRNSLAVPSSPSAIFSNSPENPRRSIVHNLPVVSKPVNTSDYGWSTSTCLLPYVDASLGQGCHPFGIVGGSIRLDDWKLLWTGPAIPGIGSNTPPNTPQYVASGFHPTTNNTIPQPFNNSLYLFHIPSDPTESNNRAATEPTILQQLLDFREESAKTAVLDLSWKWGFRDPNSRNRPASEQPACQGPFYESKYCAYGHEFDCFVRGFNITGEEDNVEVVMKMIDGQHQQIPSATACHQFCMKSPTCAWWVWNATDRSCSLHRERKAGKDVPCENCFVGPKVCPGE